MRPLWWLPGLLACRDEDPVSPAEPVDDRCPGDPAKRDPGVCGCGVADDDRDGDRVMDCEDRCRLDPEKIEPGACGCGVSDDDRDGDGLPGCQDPCPDHAGGAADGDGDGVGDTCDRCPTVPDPEQADTDGDGVGDRCACGPQPRSCVDGRAGPFPCRATDLLGFVPLATFGAASANDVWGWTDPADGTEYALLGLSNGTAFLDVSNPWCPRSAGFLPARTTDSQWRDLETVDHWAVIGSEATDHGLQVFDLHHLRGADGASFTEDAVLDGLGSSHTVTVDPVSGVVSANGATTCGGGMTFVDLSDPRAPAIVGCFDAAGYVHEAQCVTYHGPDSDHAGSVICVAAAGYSGLVVVVDATDPATPLELSRLDTGAAAEAQGGSGTGYAHQGWFTEDHRWFLFDDELDELVWAVPTTTFVLDLADLDAPALVGQHVHDTTAIDHNQYVAGGRVYQSNYTAGLRVLGLSGVAAATLDEQAFFDVIPSGDLREFEGSWSNYPWFASGVVPVTSMGAGLYLVRPAPPP